jgi:hypothetical protein
MSTMLACVLEECTGSTNDSCGMMCSSETLMVRTMRELSVLFAQKSSCNRDSDGLSLSQVWIDRYLICGQQRLSQLLQRYGEAVPEPSSMGRVQPRAIRGRWRLWT